VERVEAAGKVVLPGLVDAHVHLGVHEEGEGWAGQDTNELTEPVTPHVRALDGINPDDLGFADAVAGGVLTVNVNPGSGNPIGGQTVAVRCVGATVDEMVLRAPSGMKSALGENPKRVYGDRKQLPSTRLGTAAVIRDALVKAANYLAKLERDDDQFVERDLRWEALGLVLRGEVPWRQHCHRADDIATALRLADQFGYRLVIDHGPRPPCSPSTSPPAAYPSSSAPCSPPVPRSSCATGPWPTRAGWPRPGWSWASSPTTR
jgi:imidazolonepropionase-like amidohydrolase